MDHRAVRSLGRGFDLTCDFRLRFAKEIPGGGRLVQLDEGRTRNVVFPEGQVVCGVSEDIGFDKGDRIRFRTDVFEFNQVILDTKTDLHFLVLELECSVMRYLITSHSIDWCIPI